MKNLETLASRVDYLIKINGLTISAAAKKLNIPQPRLNDIVLGRTVNPHMKTLAKIAAGFDVLVGWVSTGQGAMRPITQTITDEEREKWRREGHSQAREGPGVFIAANATEAYLFSRIQTADHKTIHKLLEIFLDEEAKPEGSHKNGTEG